MPIWTNRYNVDEMIAKAVTQDVFYETPDNDISVTRLIDSPQIDILRTAHSHEITEDVSDRVWALFGNMMHELLAKVANDNALKEERFFGEIAGWNVSGQVDIWEDNEVRDYKTQSVWAFTRPMRESWIMQLNFLAVLCRMNGFAVDSLKIVALCRDWREQESRDNQNYPPPVLSRKVPLWPEDVALRIMEERVELHKLARAKQFARCTDEDKWTKATTWRLTKPLVKVDGVTKQKAQKKAVALFGADTSRGGDEEIALAAKKELEDKGFVIDLNETPGEETRCLRFCEVSSFCPQLKEANAVGATHKAIPK